MLCWLGVFYTVSLQTCFSRSISCQLVTFLNDRLVAWARPFPFRWQHQSTIGYECWKWLALQNITSLAHETKPTVWKQSKCRYSPLQTSMNWWHNLHKLIKIADTCMIWAKKIARETMNFIIMALACIISWIDQLLVLFNNLELKELDKINKLWPSFIRTQLGFIAGGRYACG